MLFTADKKVVKTYSTEIVQQHVFSRLAPSDDEDEDPQVVRRRNDCRKQLLILKARNAGPDERHEEEKAISKQEELQEWLNSLHLKTGGNSSSSSAPGFNTYR